MAHSMESWSSKYKLVKAFGSMDHHEIAARLGAPNLYQRTGKTMYMDMFNDSTIEWFTATNGANGSVDISASRAFTGATSLKLLTGDAVNNYAYAGHTFYFLDISKIGFEFTFAPHDDLSYVRFQFAYYTGTTRYYAIIDIYVDGSIEYMNTGGSMTELVSGSGLKLNERMWHVIKLMVDYPNTSYYKLFFDKDEYDLSSITLNSAASAENPHLYCLVKAINGAANSHWCYVDNFILTSDEQGT